MHLTLSSFQRVSRLEGIPAKLIDIWMRCWSIWLRTIAIACVGYYYFFPFLYEFIVIENDTRDRIIIISSLSYLKILLYSSDNN